MLLGADGLPLNTSLSHFGPKPVLLEGGTKAPMSPENDRSLDRSIDTRAPRPAANQVGGEAYMPSAKEAAAMSPAIQCPKCRKVCIGFDEAVAESTLPAVRLPAELNRHLYRSEICGCWVTQEWAGSINNEISHRQSGGPPREVVEMSDSQRNTLYKQLEQCLHKQMDAVAVAPTPELQLEIQNKIDAVVQLMDRVSVPMRNAKVFAQAAAEIAKAQEAALAKQQKEFESYGQQKLPDLQKAAQLAQMKALGQHGQQAKKPSQPLKTTPLSVGEPSVDRLQAALDTLNGPDWVGTIAGAFTSLTGQDERYAMKTILRDSIVSRLTHGVAQALHVAVHSYLYFLQFGCARPLKLGGIETGSINEQTAVVATPVKRAVPGITGGNAKPIQPQIPQPDLHQQLKRKKRRVKRLKPDSEDGPEK